MRAIILAALTTAACSTPQPGIEVRTVEVPVIVQKPCPGVRPQRPARLEQPLPKDANALSAVLGAKLAEYSGPGKYADQADAIFDRCPLSASESGSDGP